MATVALVKHSPPRKDGKFPICIRVGLKRRYAYETICYVKDTHWNESAKLVHSYERDSIAMNQRIRDRFRQVSELIEHYEQKHWPFTPHEILCIDYPVWKTDQDAVRLSGKKEIPTGIIKFIRQFVVPHWQGKNNPGNADKYEGEAKLLETYLDTLKPRRADLPMTEITADLLQQYFNWLRTKKRPTKSDATLRRRLSQINAVLRLADNKKIIPGMPTLEIDFDIKKTRKVKLSRDHIQLFTEHVWFGPLTRGERNAQQAVHTFLTQYYLFGARVGDVLYLKNKNVITHNNRPVKVEYYQEKGRKKAGKKLMSINISPGLLVILRLYWQPDQPEQFLLPWLQNRYEYDYTLTDLQNSVALKAAKHQATTRINQALKLACQLVGVDVTKLTSHSARHTFAQGAKRKKKSIEFIKESLGHSNYDITAEYLDDLDSDELNSELMDIYD